MKMRLERFVELGLLTQQATEEIAELGITEVSVSQEMEQDVLFRITAMEHPRTGPITEQEKIEWMETLEVLNKLDIEKLKSDYQVEFLERENYKPYWDCWDERDAHYFYA